MTHAAAPRIPQASLREEWSVASVQRLAWAMGRPAAAPAAPRAAGRLTHDPARRIRRVEALRRLAADPGATPAERALARERLAELDAASYLAAC